MIINKNQRVVFAGDSVTEDGRSFPVGEGLTVEIGQGFVRLVENFISYDYPELNVRCTNMGISGNNSRDLLARWDSDINALDPNWVVILIGINDVWWQFHSPQCPEIAVLPEEFERNVNAMLDKTTARAILMTPYFMESNRSDPMRVRMDEYGAIIKKIATERNLPCVDLQAAFDEVLKYRHPMSITWDRIHPGKFGSMVIAKALMKELEK